MYNFFRGLAIMRACACARIIRISIPVGVHTLSMCHGHISIFCPIACVKLFKNILYILYNNPQTIAITAFLCIRCQNLEKYLIRFEIRKSKRILRAAMVSRILPVFQILYAKLIRIGFESILAFDFCSGISGVLSQGLCFAFKPASEPFDGPPGVITLLV